MITQSFFIFDADGVLMDSLKLACEKFNEIAAEHFPDLPRVSSQEDLAFVYPGPLKTSLRRFGLNDTSITKFFDLHSEIMMQCADQISPFDEILKVLSEFVPNHSSAIVSSSYSDTITHVLRKSSYYREEIFTHIAGREYRKSKTEKIKSILAENNVRPSEAIYIGDKDVPLRIACVGYGYHPLNYLAAFNPDVLIQNTNDFKSFLTSNLTLH